MLLDASVINPQKFSSTGAHIGVVMLALGAFAVKELENRVVFRSVLQNTVHDLK